MEKVTFVDPDTKEEISLFVLEETQEEDGDCDAYLLKEVAAEGEEVCYEMVEDDTELAAVGKIFAELVEDTDIEYER